MTSLLAEQPTKRDTYLDGLKGVLHIVLVIDHLLFVLPGVFLVFAWVYECLGFASVAEGFIFISGFLCSTVYTADRDKTHRERKRYGPLHRALTVYVTYVVSSVLFIVVLHFGGMQGLKLGTWQLLADMPLWVAILKVCTLFYQPAFLEVLPMYCALLLVFPVIRRMLEANRVATLLMASVAIWGCEQAGLRTMLLESLFAKFDGVIGYFSLFGWQLLFVLGAICGHKTVVTPQGWLPNRTVYVVAACTCALTCFLLKHHLLAFEPGEFYISRHSIGILRLINVLSIAFLIARFRPIIAPVLDVKALVILSRQSLQVFAFHLFPIYLVAAILYYRTSCPWWAQCLFVLLCLAVIFQIALLSQVTRRALVLSAERGSI